MLLGLAGVRWVRCTFQLRVHYGREMTPSGFDHRRRQPIYKCGLLQVISKGAVGFHSVKLTSTREHFWRYVAQHVESLETQTNPKMKRLVVEWSTGTCSDIRARFMGPFGQESIRHDSGLDATQRLD